MTKVVKPKARRHTHAYEKLAVARSTLMAPHRSGGEEDAFAEAFRLIKELTPDEVAGLPEIAAGYWVKISRLMDTKGLDDPKQEGTNTVRARQMTYEERYEFSDNVNELASWLCHEQD